MHSNFFIPSGTGTFSFQCIVVISFACFQLHAMHKFRLMRYTRIATALIAFASITACSNANSMIEGTGSISDRCEFTRAYHSASASVVEVQTESPGTSGYQWYPELPPNVRLIEEGVVPPASPSGFIGAPVRQWWRFDISGASTKQTTVDFHLYQAWEGKEKAIAHCAVELTGQ